MYFQKNCMESLVTLAEQKCYCQQLCFHSEAPPPSRWSAFIVQHVQKDSAVANERTWTVFNVDQSLLAPSSLERWISTDRIRYVPSDTFVTVMFSTEINSDVILTLFSYCFNQLILVSLLWTSCYLYQKIRSRSRSHLSSFALQWCLLVWSL